MVEQLLSNGETVGLGVVAGLLVWVLYKVVTNHLHHSDQVLEKHTLMMEKHTTVLDRLIDLIDKKL